jgi:hypothetical protein
MQTLIKKLESGKIKGKRNIELAELLYNHNGRLVTSNLNHINSAYKLLDLDINVSIVRKDYSNDHVITVD